MTAIALFPARGVFLRRALLVDAASCAGMGALLALAAAPLARLFGLPEALLFYAGLALIPIAAYMTWLGTREAAPAALVWAVIAGNVLWIAAMPRRARAPARDRARHGVRRRAGGRSGGPRRAGVVRAAPRRGVRREKS